MLGCQPFSEGDYKVLAMSKVEQKTKILIFDGSHVTIGSQLYEALQKFGWPVFYEQAFKYRKKRFYKIKKLYNKYVLRKKSSHGGFYYYPHADEHVKNAIESCKPDTVIFIGCIHRYISKSLMLQLKEKLRFKLVYYDTDLAAYAANFKKLKFVLEEEVSMADTVLSFSKKTTNYLRGLGFDDVRFFPYGYQQISSEYLSSQQSKESDICFVGIPDMRRILVLENLKNYDLTIHGKLWAKYYSFISKELKEKVVAEDIWGMPLYQLLKKTKIILNISNLAFYGAETGINFRVFEVLASRGFLLTDYCEELNELFEIGRDIEAYRSQEELADKVDFYLKHDALREKIANRGYETFLKKFTWEKTSTRFTYFYSVMTMNATIGYFAQTGLGGHLLATSI